MDFNLEKIVAIILLFACMAMVDAQEDLLLGCKKRYQYKRIERTIHQSGEEYQCEGYVYQAVCGGDCKADSTTTPSGFSRWQRPIPQLPGSSSHTPAVCEPTLETEKVVTLTCKPTRKCCQEIPPCDVKIHVFMKEPVDCTCETMKDLPVDVPCHKVKNVGYHWFWITGFANCRSLKKIDMPYCTGCCESSHHGYSLGGKVLPSNHCPCCRAKRYLTKQVDVYCWQNIRPREVASSMVETMMKELQYQAKEAEILEVSETRKKGIATTIESLSRSNNVTDFSSVFDRVETQVDDRIDQNQTKWGGGWRTTATVHFIRECDCIRSQCTTSSTTWWTN